MEETRLVILDDIRHHDRKYALNLDTGTVTTALDNPPVAGLGQWRTLGLLRNRRRIFSAVFVHGKEMAFWLDSKMHILAAPISAKVSEIVPFLVRQFCFSLGANVSYTARYFFWERDWPNDDADLFSQVSRIVQSEESLRRFWYIWNASAHGRTITTNAFQQELEAWLSQGNNPRST